jgi:HSP20 family molecular chaperone IbpA
MSETQPTRDEVAAATAETARTMQVQTVPINAYETTGALVVVAPLPAVRADDVTIEVHDRCLRFTAQLRSSGPRDYLCHEWEYGGYERELDLPAGFGSAAEASLANGQLVIRVLRGEFTAPLTFQPSAI